MSVNCLHGDAVNVNWTCLKSFATEVELFYTNSKQLHIDPLGPECMDKMPYFVEKIPYFLGPSSTRSIIMYISDCFLYIYFFNPFLVDYV